MEAETRPPVPKTYDLRVESLRPLLSPALLREELPLGAGQAATVLRAREQIVRILDGRDDRLLVVVGPCSIHDTAAARDYARRLAEQARVLRADLLVVMRTYFEKPRTTVGWKGLFYDPHLDGSFAVNDGLRMARELLLDVLALGLPVACEFLDPISHQYFADLVSWAAIGARTTESQVHRQLASGLSMPVGFKNGTGGDLQVAVDAVRAAAQPHSFLGVTDSGLAGIVATRGNRDCHVVLRGGASGPNHDRAHVRDALERLRAAGLAARVLVDASHGNSGKDPTRQPAVAGAVAEQVAGGEPGIVGLMLESFLVHGRQDLADLGALVYGQSITDACLSWEETAPVLRSLAEAARARRRA